MAKQSINIPGALSGMIGTVVLTSWRGIQVLRSRPGVNRKRKPTPRQAVQRAKFALSSATLRQFGDLFDKSFQYVPGKTGMNMAIGQLLNQAIGGQYPDLVIDHSAMLVAKGTLKKAELATAFSPGKGIISFSWADNTLSGNANARDRSILVAYSEDWGVVSGINDAIRADKHAQLNVPFFSGEKVHTWMSFRTMNGEMTADSVYTGVVEVK